MASLLHKSTPWIEDSFVYACSFDASRFDDESDEEDNEFNDEEIMEPSTQNTIPDGLHDDDDDDDNEGGMKEGSRNKNKPPPSRGGKIVQIIDRGGDVNFYKQKINDDGGNDINTNCCPPYLILHDGQYSTIAFLSEEAYNSTVLRQHVRRGAMQQHIPKKSLISISQYTISTIKCCTQLTHGNNSRGGAAFGLQLLRPDMPQPHLSQIQSTLNTNLLLCLYVLGPITLIGAENQGLIGNTINVNCSVKVRRVLQSHMAQFDKVHTAHNDACVNREEEDEEEDYQHWTMVQRLEACHCYYQLLKEKRGGTIPMWPWESRLVDGEEMDDENGEEVVEEDIETVSNKGPSSGANDDMDEVVDVEAQGEETVAAIATAASPGRVERMIRKYESLEELLEGDEENVEGDNDADVEGDDAADVVGDGDDHDVVETKVGRASTGTYLAKWDDSDEDQMDDEEGGEKEAEQEGNKGKGEEGGQQQQQQQQQQHRQNNEQDEGGEEKEQGPNTKNDDAQMEQGNVAELFDNFEDINEIIDLDEEDSPPTEEVVESTSAKLNDNPMDGDTVAEQGEDLDNNNDEDGNGNAATFVGIDQMFVDEEEEEEVEEEQEEEDEDEQVPLLTQQEFGTHKEVQEEGETEHELDMPEPPQEVVASQIPIPRAAVNKGAKSSLEGDEHEDNICANEYVESQVPFPPPKDTQSSDESVREEIYEDVGTESQIPFPPRSKHQKQSLNNDEDEEVMSYPVESQIPFPQKHSSKKDHSLLKNINNKSSKSDHVRPKRTDLVIYDSDDSADWMRIRKAKTKAKSTTKKVQSQMAGEGSEESIPSSTALNTSQILDQEEEEVEDDESAEEEMQQQPDLASIARKEPSSSADPSLLPPRNTETSRSARTSAHRVHFATDDTDLKPPATATGTQATNLRELFTSVSSKASNILFQSQSNGADTDEVVTRKRKAKDDDRKEKKKEFSFATMFDRAKRSYCPSSASDDF